MACGRIGYEQLDVKSDETEDSHSESTDTGSLSDTNGDTSTPTNTNTGTGTGTDTGSMSDTGEDTSFDQECSGQPDFTLCTVVTVPDRSYDICIAGLCVSPGCGDESCNVPSPHFPLADTGLRRCFDESTLMTCPNPGEDYHGQDAQYGWDNSHPASERYTRTSTVPDEPIVKDNVTGLVWQGCASGNYGTTCSEGGLIEYVWSQAIDTCDSLSFGGYADWRLPDPYELSSIVDVGTYEPAINTSAFPATTTKSFWSSSSRALDSSQAWSVEFHSGSLGARDKNSPTRVRCVRDGPFEGRRLESLTLLGDPVVRDHLNELDWQGCATGLSGNDCATGSAEIYTWKEALAYCTALAYGGYEDWRLPNPTEFLSLVDQRRENPSIDLTILPGTPSAPFWTSSTQRAWYNNVWFVDFSSGKSSFGSKTPKANPVRCVRGGP
jgi:hypothetical protein